MEVRRQALVQTAGLRRLVLAHGFASVEHRRGTPALGGRATAGTGELRQVVEGRLSVHRHCGDMENRRVRAEEVEREIFPRKLLNQRPGFCCNRQRVIINSRRFFVFFLSSAIMLLSMHQHQRADLHLQLQLLSLKEVAEI